MGFSKNASTIKIFYFNGVKLSFFNDLINEKCLKPEKINLYLAMCVTAQLFKV